MASKIPFYLVTGFLGSGKTTLLRNFIDHYADTRKIAIVQNEFAAINIDSRELNLTGKTFDILEINNGSVFCVCLLSSFVRSLSDFIGKYQPDLIILEASGLSDPISIGQIISSSSLHNLIWLAHTYTVIDALNFQKTIERVGRNSHQIRVADTIVLNKCDLAPDTIPDIKVKLSDVNPFAKIVETSFSKIEFHENVSFGWPVSMFGVGPVEGEGRPAVESAVIKYTRQIPEELLNRFISKYCLLTYRIKGYVKTESGFVAVQTSFEQVEIKPVQTNSPCTELVMIGPGIDQKIIQQEFELLCTQN